MEPLEESLKCHRCKIIHHDCVVYDGDRKQNSSRAKRYMGNTATQDPQPQGSTSRLPSQSISTGESNRSSMERTTEPSNATQPEVVEADSALHFWTEDAEKNASSLPPRISNGPNNPKSVLHVIGGFEPREGYSQEPSFLSVFVSSPAGSFVS